MRIQVWAAAGAVFLLGIVYGQETSMQTPGVCETTQGVFPGEILNVFRVREGSIQYVVKSGGCTILLTAARFPEYRPGDGLNIDGEVQGLGEMPEEFAGYAEYLRRRNIDATIRYADVHPLVSPSASHSPLPRGRKAILERIERIFPEPEASLVGAMLLAQRGTIPEEITEQFRRTGVSHILAISGLHVSILIGVMLGMMMFLPIRPWIRAGAVIVLLWTYVWLIGAPVSTQRAAWFWTIALLAFRMRWLVSLPTIVLATVTVMVSIDPEIIEEVGFQLSFAAVTGIGLGLFLLRGLVGQSWWRGLLVVSAGAGLATWPVVAYHFGLIPLLSVVANVLVVPAMPLFLVLAGLATLISYIVPPLAFVTSFGVRVLWVWMERVTRNLAGWEVTILTDVTIPPRVLVVYYTAAILTAILILKQQGRSWREVWV